MRFLGLDLAWGEGSSTKKAAETGAVALEPSGLIVSAGWTCGLTETLAWVDEHAARDTLLFVDAPLVVDNAEGQRLCEKQVGQRYGRWRVSAHSTNLAKKHLAGVALLRELEARGWDYDDGRKGPSSVGLAVSECYPYTTIVGVEALGYADERPRYKQKPPRGMKTADWKLLRADTCDELIRRLATLNAADPPLNLRSHTATRELLEQPSPLEARSYKHREDLIDAVLCAWTASFWHRHGLDRSQVLGIEACVLVAERPATIIAPARAAQRSTLDI